MKRHLVFGCLALMLLVWLPSPASALPVGLELALLVDVSGSVDDAKFEKAKAAHAQAFQDPGIQDKIAALEGGLAVTLIYWAGEDEQQLAVDWTHITNAAEADNFATAISNTTRPFSNGSTAMGSAIIYATQLFFTSDYEGVCRFMDVSGDGENNEGPPLIEARFEAIPALGPWGAINGLPILNEIAELDSYYINNVIDGYQPFIVPAADYDALTAAVLIKLNTELDKAAAVPVPAGFLLLGSGLLGMGLLGRRRRTPG